MSKVLVIPDVHLKEEVFEYASDINPKLYDYVVCLGDIADAWYCSARDYDETYKRAVSFAKKHPNMRWCIGNHDAAYMYSSYGKIFLMPGFNYYAADITETFMKELKLILGPNLAVAHKIDKVIFSHAGLSWSFIRQELGAGPLSTEEIIDKVNRMVSPEWISHLFRDDSPLWVRPQYDKSIHMYDNGYYQVVGHTPVKDATILENVLCLDTFSETRKGVQIGNETLYVVDTMTLNYVEVG